MKTDSKDLETCMLFESGGFKNHEDVRYNSMKSKEVGYIFTMPFGFRLAKGCVYRYWN